VDGASLIGLTEAELQSMLGTPLSRREMDADVWLVFAGNDLTLRVRCDRSGDAARCASWTAVFPGGFRMLSEAATVVGLWPQVHPDEDAAGVTAPLIRRRLDRPEPGAPQSFTATVRDGRIVGVSAFDEPPDWE